MKKPLLISLGLVIIDQAVKLLISRYYANACVILLPGMLRLQPVQNTNLTWISSLIEYHTPVFLMLVLQSFGLALVLFAYRYLSYLWKEKRYFLNGMLSFLIAGITCSFVDVVFWGSSLDFIRLFDWFTFDLKDAYITIGEICVFLYGGIYMVKVYRKLNKEERKQTGILLWIKRGMPFSP